MRVLGMCMGAALAIFQQVEGVKVLSEDRPHILLITTDQQRLDSVSAYANDRGQAPSGIASPNIDRLATEGVRFTEAFSTSPVCSPCRTSLLTGLHVPVHGVTENTVSPHKDGLTVYPDVLQGLGYECFLIGKSHFSPVPSSFTFKDVHSGNTDMRCDSDSYANGSCAFYDESLFLETYLVDTMIGNVSAFLESAKNGQRMKWPSSSSSTNVSLTSTTSSSVDGGDGGKDDDDDSSPPIPDRFFVHLSFVSPHPPSTPPTTPFAWNELYAPEDLPSLNYQVGDIDLMPYQTQMLLNLLGSPDQLPAYLNEDGTPNMEVIDADRVLYHGLCSYVDKEVGRAVDWVDSMGLTQTTLVIFTSDHGSLLYDHGGPNDKHTFYDPVWHVPLVVRMPGTLPQNATARFASTVDVTAMLLVAAGVDWEGEANSHIDVYTQASLPNNTMFMAGLDVLTPLKEALTRAKAAGTTAATTSATASKGMLLKHLMVGGGKSVNKTSQEEWVGHDFYGEVIAVPRTAVPASEYRGYAVVSEHWKLVYMSEQGEGRLYDRDADPQERTDLFNDPDHASVKNSLLVGLLRWRAQQDDLQWQLSNWKNAADVGNRARNDSFYLTGRQAEYNLQATAAEADALWEAKVFNGKVAVSSQ